MAPFINKDLWSGWIKYPVLTIKPVPLIKISYHNEANKNEIYLIGQITIFRLKEEKMEKLTSCRVKCVTEDDISQFTCRKVVFVLKKNLSDGNLQ